MSKPINFYIITSTNTDKVYIGSTGNCLKYRLSEHKCKMDSTASQVINQGNYSIDLLETVECNPKERFNLEMEYVKGYGDLAVNHNKGQTKEAGYKKERYQANKEIVKLKRLEYYHANKEKISANSSTKVICECGCTVAKGSIFKHKKSKKHMELISA